LIEGRPLGLRLEPEGPAGVGRGPGLEDRPAPVLVAAIEPRRRSVEAVEDDAIAIVPPEADDDDRILRLRAGDVAQREAVIGVDVDQALEAFARKRRSRSNIGRPPSRSASSR
jgi:hypothetical protein